MNPFLIFIIAVILVNYFLELVTDLLNLSKVDPDLPKEFDGYYDEKKYRQSQEYLQTSTRFELIRKTFSTTVMVGFILLGGFNWVDTEVRTLGYGSISTGLLFVAALAVMNRIITLPFSLYETFVIEEKFGFNKMTLGTFFTDLLKGLVLGGALGGLVLAGLFWFFESTGANAWIYAWSALTVFQLIVVFLAPVVIMPLFNKFTPLEEGELKSSIEKYAQSQSFFLSGIFKMDGSKRSTKSNAFFTGFGKFRRIVLFDTLIEKHSAEELTSILAHEIGHYKMKHIFKSMALSILLMGFMFYFFSLFINHEQLFSAFQMDQVSVYASLVFIGFLYSPISRLISIFSNLMSRKHEFEADAYAAQTFGNRETLIQALKKLSVDNLSNLTPHPLKIFLEYTHPPVLKRIEAIRD